MIAKLCLILEESECRTKKIEQSLRWIDSKNPANIYAESREVLNSYERRKKRELAGFTVLLRRGFAASRENIFSIIAIKALNSKHRIIWPMEMRLNEAVTFFLPDQYVREGFGS